jgi:hypothetical protein
VLVFVELTQVMDMAGLMMTYFRIPCDFLFCNLRC